MKQRLQNTLYVTLASLGVLFQGELSAQCTTPTLVTASPSVVCSQGGTTNLNATSGPGTSINWYTVAVGGTLIGTSPSGSNYSTNAVTTTTYYAESIIPSTLNFAYTGTTQSWVVPAGVTSLTIQTWGAEGGGFALNGHPDSGDGGKGGYATGVLTVTPGNTLNIYVGGAGLTSTAGLAAGGWNGGGQGYASDYWEPGNGGGGASDVRLNGITLADRVIVAGGGGGGGEDSGDSYGDGGGATGVGYPGYDATQVGPGTGGSLGLGGGTNMGDGGGGGGGYYGGGTFSSPNIGTDTQGGGGGSAYVGGVQNGTMIAGNASMPDPNGGNMTGKSGNGYIRIITNGGCVSPQRGMVIVTVNPSPTIAVNSGSICSGNSFTITPSGANTYTIQGGNAVVSPTANATYTVVGTSSLGCVSQTFAVASVTVNALPLPTVSVNSGSVCMGQSFTLNPSGAATYTFQGGNAVVTPTSNTSYTVVGTNSIGCTSQSFATSNITVVASPSVSVSGNTMICVGETATLTANGANTYSWNTGATSSSVTVSPTVTTVYSVSGTASLSGCANTATYNLVVSPCTGLSEHLTLGGVKIYPNPNSGQFNIELTENANVQIVNSIGQLIYKQEHQRGIVAVNMDLKEKGIYFVMISKGDLRSAYRIIIE